MSLPVLATLLMLAGAQTTPAPAKIDNDTCLGCHSDPEMTVKARDGTAIPLAVKPELRARTRVIWRARSAR